MNLLYLLLLFSSISALSHLKVCSTFGHNWAAEIRCLRNLVAKCHEELTEEDLAKIQPQTEEEPKNWRFNNPSRESPIQERNFETTTSRPWVRSIRAGSLSPREEARLAATRFSLQKPDAITSRSHYEARANITEFVDSKVAQVREVLEKEFTRRVNELRNWMESELKRMEGRASSSTDLAVVRQNEIELKKLTRRVDLLAAKIHRFGEKEYIFQMTRESWYRAEEVCLEWGGHLASINSIEENNFLAALLDGESAWISLNDVQLENVYVNTDRKQTKFRHWAKGQPDNQNHNENCIEMTRTGEWADLLCLLRRPYFCKR